MKKIFKQSLLIIIIMVKFDFKNATLNTENSKKRINKTYFHHHNNIKKSHFHNLNFIYDKNFKSTLKGNKMMRKKDEFLYEKNFLYKKVFL